MSKMTLFGQIIQKLNRSILKKLVKKHKTDKHQKGFDSWPHLTSMLFCHFARSQSLRDISNGLRPATGNLNHLGNVHPPTKSNLGYQNKHRSWELFRDYYYELLKHLGRQVGFKQVKFRIKSKIFLLDASTISLCLSLFDWAKYKTKKGAIKLHTLLDFDGNLPCYANITDGKTADNKGAYDIPLIAESAIVADRFYNDFFLLNVWDGNKVFFAIRHKDSLKFTVVKENELPENRHHHILKDETIELTGKTKEKYPKRLRRIAVWDDKNQQVIELITNHLKWSCNTIGELYKSRWEIEIFFRDTKQLLHIKSFIGTGQNAVTIQIWTALITILTFKHLKALAKYKWHLSNLVAFPRINLFVKIDPQKWLDEPFLKKGKPPDKIAQGVLFDVF